MNNTNDEQNRILTYMHTGGTLTVFAHTNGKKYNHDQERLQSNIYEHTAEANMKASNDSQIRFQVNMPSAGASVASLAWP